MNGQPDAGGEGAVGPVPDAFKPDAARLAKALRNGLGQRHPCKAQLQRPQSTSRPDNAGGRWPQAA